MSVDSDLLEKLKKGDESAWKKLYELFFHALCSFGNRFVSDEAVVADIVQEVFIKVWERRTSFETVYSLRSFMYIAVRNACLNHKRDSLRVVKISLSDHLVEESLEEEKCFEIDEEVHRMIQNEVDRLPDSIKRVFNLTLLDMSICEIAQVLKVSENTVRNRRARAREILRERLKDKLLLLFL